jgi:hypothetical protein
MITEECLGEIVTSQSMISLYMKDIDEHHHQMESNDYNRSGIRLCYSESALQSIV